IRGSRNQPGPAVPPEMAAMQPATGAPVIRNDSRIDATCRRRFLLSAVAMAQLLNPRMTLAKAGAGLRIIRGSSLVNLAARGSPSKCSDSGGSRLGLREQDVDDLEHPRGSQDLTQPVQELGVASCRQLARQRRVEELHRVDRNAVMNGEQRIGVAA